MYWYKKVRQEMNEAFEGIIQQYVPRECMRDMMRYAIDGGKRLRPTLFLCMIPTEDYRPYYGMCLGLELLHSCSLVLDDLPCMDNDAERRGRPSFHVKYGEIQAKLFVGYCSFLTSQVVRDYVFRMRRQELLSGMATVDTTGDMLQVTTEDTKVAMSSVVDVPDVITHETDHRLHLERIREEIAMVESAKEEEIEMVRKILYIVYSNMGIMGACAGQFLDLCPILPQTNKKEFMEQYGSREGLQELLNLKTTTFFRIGFHAGHLIHLWNTQHRIYTDAERQQIDDLSNDFGFAFQLFDDFDDIEQDLIRKQDGEFSPNFILSFGLDEARNLFSTHMDRFLESYRHLVCRDSHHVAYRLTHEICEYLRGSVEKKYEAMRGTPGL